MKKKPLPREKTVPAGDPDRAILYGYFEASALLCIVGMMIVKFLMRLLTNQAMNRSFMAALGMLVYYVLVGRQTQQEVRIAMRGGTADGRGLKRAKKPEQNKFMGLLFGTTLGLAIGYLFL